MAASSFGGTPLQIVSFPPTLVIVKQAPRCGTQSLGRTSVERGRKTRTITRNARFDDRATQKLHRKLFTIAVASVRNFSINSFIHSPVTETENQ
jgi:hypothetical protein